MRGVVLVKE